MQARTLILAALVYLVAAASLRAQSAGPPLYRIFLEDGTALSSFGEWARVEDSLVFSMPLTPNVSASELHLVSLPVQRVDLARTERYADTVRAANYAANRGEADFAKLSGDVAHALNQVALIPDPAERLVAAERARRSLTEWAGNSYGYRAAEVQEIVGVLDGVISGLRASAGLGRFDLSLTATTSPPPALETLLEPPDHTAVVQNLIAASALVASPAEKVSLLQSVVVLLDRAVGLLPDAFAATIRATALGAIAEEQRVDTLYAKLRNAVLADAARLAERADVRGVERLRARLRTDDAKLGARRPDDIAAVVATLEAHLDAAHRLRLAQDQWLLRIDGLRTYHHGAAPFVQTLAAAETSLDDIRALAGPPPQRLRLLARRLSRAGRRLALLNAPAEVSGVHAIFRSAYELAENAVQLRMDAVAAADVDLAHQASAAASGALMLLGRGRADLEAALQPPIRRGPVSQP
jgi:hypothetical protein